MGKAVDTELSKVAVAALEFMAIPNTSLLLYCHRGSADWVNYKPGPKVSAKAFNELLEGEYIVKLTSRVIQREHEGPWYAITDKGRELVASA